MTLTSREILLILEIITDKYGPGYSDEPKIGHLQAKLSMMLEVARNTERLDKEQVALRGAS